MGANQSDPYLQEIKDQANKYYKNTSTAIQPFKEGQQIMETESQVKRFLQQHRQPYKSFKTEHEDEDEGIKKVDKIKLERESPIKLQSEIETIEKKYFKSDQDILNSIREDFESYSKDNKMGKKKLLEYYGIQELDNLELGNRFFQSVKNSMSLKKSGPYVDYSKFIKTISLLSQDNVEGRAQFLYSLFDQNLDGNIDKEEFRNVMKMFLEAMLQLNFDDIPPMQQLKDKIMKARERDIEMAINELVDENFKKFAVKNNIMNDKSWEKWLLGNPNLKAVVEYNPHTNLQ